MGFCCFVMIERLRLELFCVLLWKVQDAEHFYLCIIMHGYGMYVFMVTSNNSYVIQEI
jgi:hypothetical protein